MDINTFFEYLIGYAVVFLICVFITRAIFSIPKFLDLQRAQVHLLSDIALKNGVDPEVVKKIYTYNEVPVRPQTNEEKREELKQAKIRAGKPEDAVI
jgi:hypothetical protein